MTIGLPAPIGSPVPFDASRQGVVERTAFARLRLPPTLIGDCKAKDLIGEVDPTDVAAAFGRLAMAPTSPVAFAVRADAGDTDPGR